MDAEPCRSLRWNFPDFRARYSRAHRHNLGLWLGELLLGLGVHAEQEGWTVLEVLLVPRHSAPDAGHLHLLNGDFEKPDVHIKTLPDIESYRWLVHFHRRNRSNPDLGHLDYDERRIPRSWRLEDYSAVQMEHRVGTQVAQVTKRMARVQSRTTREAKDSVGRSFEDQANVEHPPWKVPLTGSLTIYC